MIRTVSPSASELERSERDPLSSTATAALARPLEIEVAKSKADEFSSSSRCEPSGSFTEICVTKTTVYGQWAADIDPFRSTPDSAVSTSGTVSVRPEPSEIVATGVLASDERPA